MKTIHFVNFVTYKFGNISLCSTIVAERPFQFKPHSRQLPHQQPNRRNFTL